MRDAALVLAALSGLAGLFGVLRWLRSETSPSFWIAVRVGQAAAIAYAVLTGVAYLSDWSPSNKLFYLYALLPVAIGFVAEQLRVISDQVLSARDLEDAAAVGRLPPSEQQGVVTAILRREMGVMAAAAIVVCFLAL